MKIIGEYLNPLVEAADGNESDSLGLVQSRFNKAKATIGDTTTRAQMWGYKVKSGSGYSASSLGLGRGVGEDEDAVSQSELCSHFGCCFNLLYSLQRT
jgi:hypothetical protein